MKFKILMEGIRDGWIFLVDVDNELVFVIVVLMFVDDFFLYFFILGIIGFLKVVVYIYFIYFFGYLFMVVWVGCRYGDVYYNIFFLGWVKFVWSSFFVFWNMGVMIFVN